MNINIVINKHSFLICSVVMHRNTVLVLCFNSFLFSSVPIRSFRHLSINSVTKVEIPISSSCSTHSFRVQKVALEKLKMSELVSTTEKQSQNYHNFSWQQTMLRIKDPKVTVPFYEENFGFKLIHKYDFPQWSFSLYFLAIFPVGESFELTPGTKESEEYLWSMKGTCLELTHNYGSESDPEFKVLIFHSSSGTLQK